MGISCRSIVLANAVAMLVGAAGARAGDWQPRYELKPGMELSYKGSSTFRHQSGMHLTGDEITAWVLRRNTDGSVRVVLRQGSRFTATSVADTVKNLIKKQNSPPMDYNFAAFDLFPDGRLGPGAQLGYRITPSSVFPRLPESASQAQLGWGQREEPMAQERRYSALKSEPDGWVFHGERVGPENKLYGMTAASTIHFDAHRGVVRRIDHKFTQEYGFKGKGTGSIELTAVETRDAAWLASFGAAADRYFAASKAYEQATEAASKDAARSKTLLAEAKAALVTARESVAEPIFRSQLDREIAGHESMASYYADAARRRAEVIDKPAADWKLQGLDGKPHALADYRGKVVILDFWYRGCGWCIKAMPQLNALAQEFAQRPVAVLGMNTDRDEADTKFVVDAMGLKYETLCAAGVPEKYGVQGFPTLILIDPQGKVRDVHVGYSPTLRASLTRQIEGLLPK